jgi:hypothetical protein
MAINLVKAAAGSAPHVTLSPEKQTPLGGEPATATAAAYGAASQQDTVSLTQGWVPSALGKIADHIEGTNALAKTLHGAVASLQQAAGSLGQAKQELVKIIKNFPPFGIDSEDRRSILRAYSSLRKEIDGMTVPAPPKPFYDEHSGTLGQYFDSQGKLALGDVPVLPLDAPDQHVRAVAAAIDGKIASFSASRQAISDLFNAR